MPYTYLLGWKNYNKYYYGVRHSKKCNPAELCITYFSSSKYVKEMIINYGIPDIIQIRKTFVNKDQAIAWEHKVLRRLKVTKNEIWVNKTDNKSINGSKEAYSKASKTKWLEAEYRQKISDSTKRLWKNPAWVKQTRDRVKNTLLYKKQNNLFVKQARTEEQKERYRLAALKRWQDKEYQIKQSQSVKNSWTKRDKLNKDPLTGKFIGN